MGSSLGEFVNNEISVTPRQAKEAYVIAQEMKFIYGGPSQLSLEQFRAKLAEKLLEVRAYTDSDLDKEVERDNRKGTYPKERRIRLSSASFVFGTVALEHCSVWRHFGYRRWASGLVPCVVKTYEQRGRKDDKLEDMIKLARGGYYRELPIIVMRGEKNPSQFCIDDGSHRSVTQWIAGEREVPAFIGIATQEKLD